MEKQDKHIKIIVAAPSFLLRLGIKTLLNVIGFDAELKETSTINGLETLIKNNAGSHFVLIHEGLLPEKEPNSLAWLQANFPLIEVMLICKGERPCYEGCAFMSEQIDQRRALMIFQDFFFGEGRLQDGAFKSENGLSIRELEILQAVAKGYSNKEIADMHFISINTVITHRKNITEKLGIKTIAGLTVYALMNKYVKPGEVKQ